MFLYIVLPAKSTQKEKPQKQEREEGRINKFSFLDDIMMLVINVAFQCYVE
jgi:hypothetical protein